MKLFNYSYSQLKYVFKEKLKYMFYLFFNELFPRSQFPKGHFNMGYSSSYLKYKREASTNIISGQIEVYQEVFRFMDKAIRKRYKLDDQCVEYSFEVMEIFRIRANTLYAFNFLFNNKMDQYINFFNRRLNALEEILWIEKELNRYTFKKVSDLVTPAYLSKLQNKIFLQIKEQI